MLNGQKNLITDLSCHGSATQTSLFPCLCSWKPSHHDLTEDDTVSYVACNCRGKGVLMVVEAVEAAGGGNAKMPGAGSRLRGT